MDVPVYIGGPKHGHDCNLTDPLPPFVYIADPLPLNLIWRVEGEGDAVLPSTRRGTYRICYLMQGRVQQYIVYIWEGWDN